MPAWLRRLFSRTYRNALAAEAAGDYVLAAEQYALTGMPGKVAEMHFVRARRVEPADRADVLEDALRWFQRAEDEHGLTETFPVDLAKALLEEAKALSRGDPRRRSLAVEAASLFESAGDLAEAGEAHELVGDREEAARCYEAAGDIESMERLLEEDSRTRSSSRSVSDAFDEYESAMATGARNRARDALRRCCAEAPGQGYERMLTDLEKRFPIAGSIDLRVDGVRHLLVGAAPAFIGRGDAHVRLRHAGISRRHAAVDIDADGFHLRDAGSRNGTLLGGLPLAGRVPLTGSGVIGLGEHCSLQFAVDTDALGLEVLDGPDRGLKAVVVRGRWMTPGGSFGLEFRSGYAAVSSMIGAGLLLNGARTNEAIVALIGDTIEAAGGGRIEVIG